jgi:hypothetical protein
LEVIKSNLLLVGKLLQARVMNQYKITYSTV